MSSSGRDGGKISGRRGTGGGDKNNPAADPRPRAGGQASSLGNPHPPTSTTVGGASHHAQLGSPSRTGQFAHAKIKIGPWYQCTVPKFVPPPARTNATKAEGGGGSGDESDGNSSSAGSSSLGDSRHDVPRGGGRGGRGGRGRGRGSRGGRGRGIGGGESGGGLVTVATDGTSMIGGSNSGETSAVDIANAAAEQLQEMYNTRSIPKGGLCVHKPHRHGAPTSTTLNLDEHDDFLTFTRNVFLQTPRPEGGLSIDDIWDDATSAKFKVLEQLTSERSDAKDTGKRPYKRKASSMASEDNDTPSTTKKVVKTAGEYVLEKTYSTNSEKIVSSKMEAKVAQYKEATPTDHLPLCGLEDDELALSYLHANFRGDSQKAKLSIMVHSDRGNGVQRRRQLRKKRKESSKSYPATEFSSESWRWRVHRARSTMLGDYRSSSDSTYHYFNPEPIATAELVSGNRPWRLRRIGEDDYTSVVEEETYTRSRSLSITWSATELEKAKHIWRSILAYSNSVLAKMKKNRHNDSKPPLRDLLELVGKAHALPTPEETYGRRDPSARQMSDNMNSVIDAIEKGRDSAARILKCLKDNGDGIEIDVLRKSIEEIDQTCPVGLIELDTVRQQIHDATLWEEKLENNVDHEIVDTNASDGEDTMITEKKLTLEKVEKLVSNGRNLTLRPRSLIRLQNRVEEAYILQRRIVAWNEARNQENPQNMKFVSTLIKQANKIDLAFPELLTLTDVHKKAEEWIDRASIAVRTTISFDELESLVATGESLPLNVSDVLEKLQKRLKEAKEWMIRVDEIVAKSDDYLMWLRRFRHALEDSDKSAHLLSLLSEGSRIPVTMDCSKLLQIEIDARHWTIKAKPWIPENLGTTNGEICAPQKRGKIDDVEECLDRASSIRDRLWFGDNEKSEWVLDGEAELTQMMEMAETWFDKYDDILSNDSRRNGKLCLPMSKLREIVDEVNRIPLNLGSQATKMNRIFSQADEWMTQYFPLLTRCGIESSYTPADAESVDLNSTELLKIDELSEAVDDADSDLSVDLDEVVKLKKIVDTTKAWIDRVNAISTMNDSSRKKCRNENYTSKDISDLIDEGSSMIVDVTGEIEHLKLEQSIMASWRIQAQQTIREILSAFKSFHKDRTEASNRIEEPKSDVSDPPAEDQSEAVHQIVSGSMTTRHIDSRRGTPINSCSSGSETPAFSEIGGKQLSTLVSSYYRSAKSLNVLTPEGEIAEELNEVIAWLTKSFKLTNTASDIYDKKNYSKLDKMIESGRILIDFGKLEAIEIPEDATLLGELRESWAAAMKDDIDKLLEIQLQRDKFIEWSERVNVLLTLSDKKVSINQLKELDEQSAVFPSSSEIVLRVKQRIQEATAWIATISDIINNGKKIPLDEAKDMADSGERLNINCEEFKILRTALKATKSWLLRVKKCGASSGNTQVAVSTVTELVHEHNTFLVTAMDELSELKSLMCGYCVCRQPYEGFMIGCDGCEEWYHGTCVGITEDQAEKFDKYVCVRCSTLRVYKENAATVAGVLRKWTSIKGLTSSRSADSQRYGRKVRSAERDILKATDDLLKNEQDLNSILGATSHVPSPPDGPPTNGDSGVQSQSPSSQTGAKSQFLSSQNGKRESVLRGLIEKARTTIGSCEKRMEGYKAELIERKNLEARENALAPHLKKWCNMVKQEVFAPSTREKAELSRPSSDGSTSTPMDKAAAYADALGIANLPDIDVVLNSFKIFSWCLNALEVLSRKPRVEEVRSLISLTDSGYFKLPEAKCVRMLRSMASRAQIWQSRAKKALTPVPGEKAPYHISSLQEILFAAKQIPLIMPEEARLWNTIEDRGARHCICGGPSDGSFMLGCDSCDRWFHGSCMQIDKVTGDALSNWICPPCAKGVSPTKASSPQKQQELFLNPPLAHHSHLDISSHAPDPQTLWPPFGLRNSKESIEVLGTVGESDNEEFEWPIQPNTNEKPESVDTPQLVGSSHALSMSETPQHESLALVSSTTDPSVSQPSVTAALSLTNMAASSQQTQQPIQENLVVVNGLLPSLSTKTDLSPTTTLLQMSDAPAANAAHQNVARADVAVMNVEYSQQTGPTNIVSSQNLPGKIDNPPITLPQQTNPVNSKSLNCADLSVAVANLDAFVLGAGGDETHLQHVSTESPFLQTETVPTLTANGQSPLMYHKAP